MTRPESAEGAALCAMIDDDVAEVERRLATFNARELEALVQACGELRAIALVLLRERPRP